jgi:putative phosphoesterase
MRIAALYDIHANLPALEAVLEDVRRANVDLIVVGGDVVPGPMPRETMACLRDLELPARFIRGNGDREVLAQRTGAPSTMPEPYRELMRWTASQLDTEDERLMTEWPPTIRVDVPGLGSVLFCHATPTSDTEVFTRRTPDERLRPMLDGLDVALVVCGHTHMQFDRTVGTTRVVNAGSVGMPFGAPGADWLLLGPDVQLKHARYDLVAAADRIRASAYPQAEEFAARNVLEPPSEQSMLDTFGKAEPT